MARYYCWIGLLAIHSTVVTAFSPVPPTAISSLQPLLVWSPALQRTRGGADSLVGLSLAARSRSTGASAGGVAKQKKEREAILNRDGEYFRLDRMRGKVEFGRTVNLVTNFNKDASNQESIATWLEDERRVATSIWDPKLMTELGDSMYQLQLMTLKFVTIQLSPSVDVQMWIDVEEQQTKGNGNGSGVLSLPAFKLQSVSFDPNVQIFPGIGLTAEQLGIQISVVGELRPSADGRGVTGQIGFVSGGDLPPPLRLAPEGLLKTASRTISKTVADFAVRSFQDGASAKYREFMLQQQNQP
eukprot:CAMPEP_0198293822 /NCGR_PEP_ID=MMETSP1449-20131203/18999_1 /TAXON_ID=420275 /ORGANISM="Attheya septentrionalis, Strain CCMP2084" /LENGTH=299 /DNA_ID=CAMNT_0043993555 /DNA_START=122 /DNA_END=1021 /DNA_ORIENTATION=-